MKACLRLCIWLCASTIVPAQGTDIGPAPGRLIDVGGRRINVNCSGHGSPTVILEAGASSFAIDWSLGAPFNLLPPELYERRLALDRRLIESVPRTLSYEEIVEYQEGQRAALSELRA